MTIERLEEPYDALNLIKEVFFSHGNMGLSASFAQKWLELLSAKGEQFHYLGGFENGLLEAVLAYDDSLRMISLVSRNDRLEEKRQLVDAYVQDEGNAHAALIRTTAFPKDKADLKQLGFEAVSEDGPFTEMEYPLQKKMLGQTVTVTIDRPYGSFHPHYPDTIYLCNYGYVEEVLAADGEFQDAYVIGVQEPLERFTGKVIAIILRKDDVESKWVVARDVPQNRQEVIDAVGMIEQYFDTRILWYEP